MKDFVFFYLLKVICYVMLTFFYSKHAFEPNDAFYCRAKSNAGLEKFTFFLGFSSKFNKLAVHSN